MKPLAIGLIILCLAAMVGVGYLYVTAEVTVTDTACIALDAANAAETFNGLKDDLGNDSFVGTVFEEEVPGDAGEYQFYTYTLRVQNGTFVPADVLEIQVVPVTGDVLQLGDTVRHNLGARAKGDFQATILTRKGVHNVRELILTWYQWGIPFSRKVTCNPSY